jgi:hypothetical protein
MTSSAMKSVSQDIEEVENPHSVNAVSKREKFSGARVDVSTLDFGSSVAPSGADGWGEDDDDEEDTKNFAFDELETELMGERAGFAASSSGAVSGHGGGGGGGKIKLNLGSKVSNEINTSEKKANKKNNNQGRDDRATQEQVLDPRTRLILFKLLNSGFLNEIDGCLSTGKEANVYYARGGGSADR